MYVCMYYIHTTHANDPDHSLHFLRHFVGQVVLIGQGPKLPLTVVPEVAPLVEDDNFKQVKEA